MTHEMSPGEMDKIYIEAGTVLETGDKKVEVLGEGDNAVIHSFEERPNGQTLDRMDPLVDKGQSSESGIDYGLRSFSVESARRASRRR